MRIACGTDVQPFAACLATLLILCGCDVSPDPATVPAPVPAAMPAPTFVSLAAQPTGHALSFRVTAPKDRALYLDNCNGAISWGLEHARSGNWEPAWGAEINGCHSAPIEIAAGTGLEFHERVSIRPGDAVPAGPYRVAVYGLYFTHDSPHDHARNAEVPHPWRLSPPFRFEP